MEEKNLQLDRLVFFSDAIVAIAITLLAFNIKIDPPPGGHLTFADLLCKWKTFAAFLLSFINIANFWRIHHQFFAYIKKVDNRMLFFNIAWLFFIILIPFSTSLVSSYFFDTPSILIYSINIFLIAICQNFIWDYPSLKPGYMKEDLLDANTKWQFRLFCNLDMLNGLIAVLISIKFPLIAFIFLFTKLPVGFFAMLLYPKRFRKQPSGKNSLIK